MKALRLARGEFGAAKAKQLCALWDEVWPNEDSTALEERAADFLIDSSSEHRMQENSELFHVVEFEDRIVAVARTYVREVCFEGTGRSGLVLALAGVCSSPKLRGKGLGAMVVKDAFARLGPELPYCLYQTTVPAFYEKLGARLVENDFRNSYAADPQARPWWDKFVMVYGLGENWPEGRVDLCGVAY